MGVTGRLLVLVLLPLLVLTFASGPWVLRVDGDARRSQTVKTQVSTFTAELNVSLAVSREWSQADLISLWLLSSYSRGRPAGSLGLNLRANLLSDERATDNTMDDLPASLTRLLRPFLVRARRAADHAFPEYWVFDSQYNPVLGGLYADEIKRFNNKIGPNAISSGSSALVWSLAALDGCLSTLLQSSLQVKNAFPLLSGTARDPQSLARQVFEENDIVDHDGYSLGSSRVPGVERAWAVFMAGPAVHGYQTLMQDAALGMVVPAGLTSPPLPKVPNSRTVSETTLINAMRGADGDWRLTSSVVDEASRAFSSSATAVATADTRSCDEWTIFLVIDAVVALGIAIVLARSIARPLGRLALAARSVVGGDLVVVDLPGKCPTQTAIIADALNDLIHNLRLLEAKAEALATCDLDSGVLSLPLPGRVGNALQSSARILANSFQLQERLAHEASHDSLTRLLNRTGLITVLEQALARGGRWGDLTAVLYIDLDRFKQANDSHGHQAGDEVLRQVGLRLCSCTRDGDSVGRLGGDEFMVIAERVESSTEAHDLARRLVGAVSSPVDWNGHAIEIGATVGVAVSQGSDVEALNLLERADKALYWAKQRGRGLVGVWDEMANSVDS